MGTKRTVPRELCDIFAEYTSLFDLKQIYVKRPFGYKKAVRAGNSAEKKRTEFWKKLYKLYPDTFEGEHQWEFNRDMGIIYYDEE